MELIIVGFSGYNYSKWNCSWKYAKFEKPHILASWQTSCRESETGP